VILGENSNFTAYRTNTASVKPNEVRSYRFKFKIFFVFLCSKMKLNSLTLCGCYVIGASTNYSLQNKPVQDFNPIDS